MSLERIIIDTGKPGVSPVGSVIWMHGFGADAHDFEPIIPMLDLKTPLRFVFPNAPLRPITISGGAKLRAWYDINPQVPMAASGEIKASVALITEIVADQAASGISPQRVVLAGFSQGGVIAMELGLAFPEKLAGILALSTYVHDPEHLAQRIGPANRETPILMVHGQADQMIPMAMAVNSRTALTDLNYRVEWREYPMGHEVCQQEITAIGEWLNTIYT